MPVRNIYARARAPAHPGALLCTVARWIVFASSSRKSPRPTPTHPCLCLGEHLVLVISRGKGCGGLGWRGHEVRGFLTRIQASRGKGAHPPARLEAVGMPTTHAVACPFPFNFLFFLCFIERAWPGGRLDYRCLFQTPRAIFPAAARLTAPNPTQTVGWGRLVFSIY